MRRHLQVREFIAYILASLARLVVCAIFALGGLFVLLLLVALFLPSGKETAHKSHCLSNLRQLSAAFLVYVEDYDGAFPASDSTSDRWDLGPHAEQFRVPKQFRSSSRWVAQVLPYARDTTAFACPHDASRKRNVTTDLGHGATTPFPVSYGPNRLFVNPRAYGWRGRSIVAAGVDHPESKYLLGDCGTAYGFDMATIAYLRYPNYDPSRQQNGWSPEQYRSLGRIAQSDRVAEPVTRHELGSNVMFADGHVKWLRHDEIPDNDGPRGRQYPRLLEAMVPWRSAGLERR